jgi:putative transposase
MVPAEALQAAWAAEIAQRGPVTAVGEHLWLPSYLAASCGGAPLEIIQHYAEQHRTPGG